MNEPFNQHLKQNAETWHELAKRGFVKTEDLVKARNYDNKYSYAEQNKALKNINDSLASVINRNPDSKQIRDFAMGVADATDEMIRDKVKSSFRDLDKITESDIRMKAAKLGIPYDEFKSNVDKVKTEINTQKGRERRAKEIEDMAWYNPQKWATSDYEKQRYIDDPNTSFIGKEGKFNPYSKEGQMAISDAAFGVAGAVGDVLPGVGGIVVGPAVRAARDVNHVYNDSKFKKSGTEVAQDTAEDLLFNVGADILPTSITKYLPRVINKAAKGDVGSLTDLALKADSYNEALKQSKTLANDLKKFGYDETLDNVDKLNNMSFRDLKKAYNSTKDQTLKQELGDAAIRGENGKTIVGFDKKKVEDVVSDYWASNKPGKLSDDWNKFGYTPNGDYTQNMKDALQGNAGEWIQKQMNATEAGKGARRLAALERGWENYGDRVYKSIGTTEQAPEVSMGPFKFGKRPSSKITKNDREDIDWFKENYARDWAAGFKPRGKEDEPIMKAYREWQEENKQTKPKFSDIMRGE